MVLSQLDLVNGVDNRDLANLVGFLSSSRRENSKDANAYASEILKAYDSGKGAFVENIMGLIRQKNTESENNGRLALDHTSLSLDEFELYLRSLSGMLLIRQSMQKVDIGTRIAHLYTIYGIGPDRVALKSGVWGEF